MIPAWVLAMMEELFVPEAESLAIYAAFTTPPTQARKVLIDNAVKALKAAGVWSQLDALWVTAAADSQAARVNWIDPGTYDLTAVNSPAFTADRGYKGDGATSYLATGMVADALTHYAQNDASTFAWNTLEHAGDNSAWLLGSDSNASIIAPRRGDNRAFVRINNSSGSITSSALGTALGSVAASRTGAAALEGYRDGVSFGTATTASETGAWSLYLLRNATAFNGSGRIGAASVGAALSDTEQLALHEAVEAYMVGVGAA